MLSVLRTAARPGEQRLLTLQNLPQAVLLKAAQ